MNDSRREARAIVARLVLVLAFAPVLGIAEPTTARRTVVPADTARVVITRPTVIAYLVIAAGAVDSSPDLAVLADDWSYAMATLGDSLREQGVDQLLVTGSALRIASHGAQTVTLSLDDDTGAGYIFVRPGAAPCLRRGAAGIDAVLALVRELFASREPGPTSAQAFAATCSRGAG